MDKVNNASLDLEIARQCAPVLADVKSSNLLILGKPAKAPKEAFFREAGISTYRFTRGARKLFGWFTAGKNWKTFCSQKKARHS